MKFYVPVYYHVNYCNCPRRTHCLYSSSMQMWIDGGHIRYSPFVVPLQRRAHSSPFVLSDVVQRGLSSTGIPSMLEPSGLDRGDGKRPDGITVNPYSRVRCLIWDATYVNTLASSNLIRAALAAGSVDDAAEVRKIAKYAELGRRFIFQPVAVETSSGMGKSTIQFFEDLGRRLAVRFQDQRESDFLSQIVSLAILRGNAFSILQSCRD